MTAAGSAGEAVTPGQAALPPLPPKWTGKFRVLATVEAVQLVDDLRNHTETAAWIEGNGGHAEIPFAEPCLYIETPRGRKRAGIGDWIVRGVTGEFFPVEPGVFAETYEQVHEITGEWHDVPDHRALLGKATSLLWDTGMPGNRQAAGELRASGGLEALS